MPEPISLSADGSNDVYVNFLANMAAHSIEIVVNVALCPHWPRSEKHLSQQFARPNTLRCLEECAEHAKIKLAKSGDLFTVDKVVAHRIEAKRTKLNYFGENL